MSTFTKNRRTPVFHWMFLLGVVVSYGNLLGCQSLGKKNESNRQWISTNAQLLDQVVAVVEGRPITCSEVTLELRINRAVLGECGVLVEPITGKERKEVLGALIDQILVLGEYRRYGQSDGGDQDLEEDFQAIQSACLTKEGLAAFLRSLELTVSELLARRSKTLDAQRLLTARVVQVVRTRASREIGRESSNEEAQGGDNNGKVPEEVILHEILEDLRSRREIRIMGEFGGTGNC